MHERRGRGHEASSAHISAAASSSSAWASGQSAAASPVHGTFRAPPAWRRPAGRPTPCAAAEQRLEVLRLQRAQHSPGARAPAAPCKADHLPCAELPQPLAPACDPRRVGRKITLVRHKLRSVSPVKTEKRTDRQRAIEARRLGRRSTHGVGFAQELDARKRASRKLAAEDYTHNARRPHRAELRRQERIGSLPYSLLAVHEDLRPAPYPRGRLWKMGAATAQRAAAPRTGPSLPRSAPSRSAAARGQERLRRSLHRRPGRRGIPPRPPGSPPRGSAPRRVRRARPRHRPRAGRLLRTQCAPPRGDLRPAEAAGQAKLHASQARIDGLTQRLLGLFKVLLVLAGERQVTRPCRTRGVAHRAQEARFACASGRAR